MRNLLLSKFSIIFGLGGAVKAKEKEGDLANQQWPNYNPVCREAPATHVFQ